MSMFLTALHNVKHDPQSTMELFEDFLVTLSYSIAWFTMIVFVGLVVS